ncbi:putative outer membrane repeat protein [Tahibacter aquaticus]|uniref:Putative outer membrane repeat protein n=1 Tax=Tahibacter aquaticus TaxID=520092 RepID=A0A4R6Z9U9_9GAMM|nr:hypothetical protein [Tahibacter aquaticus]TDR48693.1 putative outer membrane repeat protein [Tahibacter aquaticus]
MPFVHPIARSCVLAAGLLAAASAAAVPQYFIVGDPADPRCQFSTIAAAVSAAQLNGPGLDYVMVATNASYSGQALNVFGQSLLIEGGYADCDLNPDPNQPLTPIIGNGADPVLRIAPSAAGNYEVRLSRVRLSGGGSTTANGGGIRLEPFSNTFVKLSLDNTEVSGNRASGGGGIYAVRGTSPGGQYSVILRAGTRITGNTAGSNGGGLNIVDGSLYIAADDVRIGDNTAGGAGGGIAMLGGTLLVGNPELLGPRNDVSGALVEQNSAGTLGGGIYLFGASTLMEAHELIVNRNTAGGSGGGIAASNGARLSLLRDYSAGLGWYCPPARECSRVSSNQVGNGVASGTRGGALALYGGARAELAQTVVRHNVAQDASAILVDGASVLQTEGVVFTGNRSIDLSNQTGTVIRAGYLSPSAPPDLRIAYSTFMGNVRRDTNGNQQRAIDLVGQQGTTLAVYSSAFLDSPYGWTMYSAHTSDCTLRRSGGALDGNGTHSRDAVTAEPSPFVFLNAGMNDWRPGFNSPLTDFCDSTAYIPRFRDRELQPRCRDEAKANRFGSCDVGAWENDQLFADGYNG